MITPENTAETPMKKSERLIRGIGGYTLGFLGISLQAQGILSANPLAFAGGTGITYLSHRILEPLYNSNFGTPKVERSPLARFARFNVGLVPTYIGASLVNAAIFGHGSTLLNYASQSTSHRLLEGALGVTMFFAGNLAERRMHTGEPLVVANHDNTEPQLIEAQLHDEPTEGRMNRLFTRVKEAWSHLRSQPIAEQPAPTIA